MKTDDELIYIFKHLEGKESSAIDNIPNLVPKKVSEKLIAEFRIFNTLTNMASIQVTQKTLELLLFYQILA